MHPTADSVPDDFILFPGSPEGWCWDDCEAKEWSSPQSHQALLDLPEQTFQ